MEEGFKDPQNVKADSASYDLSDMSVFLGDKKLADSVCIVNGRYPIGHPQNLGQNGIINADELNSGNMSTSEPGVLVLEWIPTPGVSTHATSPINRAGTDNYRKFRNGNWTQNYFDIADVSFYHLATSNCYILYNWLGLIYKHIGTFETTNLYTPRCVVEGLGIDFMDTVKHQARILNLIQQTERKLKLFALPKAFKVARRWLSMSAKIYKDRDIDKSQYILFAPKGIFKYDIASSKLVFVPLIRDHLLKIEEIEDIVTDVLNTLYPDEEMMRFNADVTNYITKDVYTIHDIEWGDMDKPVYVEGLLQQLHNADILSYESVTNLDVEQIVNQTYDSIIRWNPTFTTKEPAQLVKRIIDVPVDQPDTSVVMQSCAWKFVAKLEGSLPSTVGGTCQFTLKSCGTELIMNPKLYIYDSTNMEVVKIPMNNYINATLGESDYVTTGHFIGFPRYYDEQRVIPNNNFGVDWNSLIYLNKINKAPLQYITSQGVYAGGVKTKLVCINGEIANTIILEDEQVIKIQECALLSAFGLNDMNLITR